MKAHRRRFGALPNGCEDWDKELQARCKNVSKIVSLDKERKEESRRQTLDVRS